MAELTPEMQAAGIFLDASGIPTWPDGTPALPQNRPPSDTPRGDTSAGILASIAAQAAAANIGAGEGRGGESGVEPPQELQTVGGFPFGPDPLSYGFGPYYGASPQDYPENRTPLAPPLWNPGMAGEQPEGALNWDQPGSWEQFHNPRDRSTGGGFFTAQDQFPSGVPFAFQQGANSPSTNNWRLLPPPYNSPRYIMRNGRIIDLQATDLRGPPVPDIGFGNNYGGPLWNLGTGAGMGYPAGRSAGYTQSFGWPGQQAGWASGTYWTG